VPRIGIVLALSLAGIFVAVQPASASRPPTAEERSALSGTFPARCLLIRVSTADPSWAGTTLTPHPRGYCEQHGYVFDGGTFLRHRGTTWRSVLSASDARGACARIPNAVLRDLPAIAEAVGCGRAADPTSVTFQSPSGNIVCRMARSSSVEGGGIAACLVRSSGRGAIVQGRTGTALGSGTITNPSGRVLSYRSSISVGNFGCESAVAEMTCRNTVTGHGFSASRAGIRFF
jgi:hypothetical protein